MPPRAERHRHPAQDLVEKPADPASRPVVLLLIALGFHLEYPELRGFNFQGGIHLRNSLIAMWLGLGIYTGAFIAENVRAGILAISKGQTEAAFALGLQPGKTMRLVILPQALRVIIPPLISQYLNITKNTSLGSPWATWTCARRWAASPSTRPGAS
jgi:general L-amino acid transport system permease protein